MASPCFFTILLVLPVLLPAETTCLDIEQDDTGLIQSPVRQTVEVTKVRSTVGNTMNQKGAAAALPTGEKDALVHPLSAAIGAESAAGSKPLEETGAANDVQPVVQSRQPGGGPAKVTSDPAQPSRKVDVALSNLEAAAKSDKAPVDKIATKDKSAETSPGRRELEKSASASSPQLGFSLFQMDQDFEQDQEVNQKGAPAAYQQSADNMNDAVSAQDDVAWNAEMTEASFRAKLAQVLVLVVAIALVVNLMFRLYSSKFRPRDALSTKMRKKLERMHVATGQEIRSICVTDNGSTEKSQSLSMPLRIQGRVTCKSACPLTAPLSGRSCVLYSASVSQHRHDGVHQPPVAFSSTSMDFTVQLEDCPEMLLEVNSQDVFPFDMESGRYACELALGDAPDTWRGFMLANLTLGAEGGGPKGQPMNRVDLGAKGPLNFRECALVVGARVTCIGDVVREHNGKLRLCPWSPPCPSVEETTKSKSRSWLTPEADPWLHKLMISDDSHLITEKVTLPGKCRSCTGNF